MNTFKTLFNAVSSIPYKRFIEEHENAIRTLNAICSRAVDKVFRDKGETDLNLATSYINMLNKHGGYGNHADKFDGEHEAYLHKLFRDDQLNIMKNNAASIAKSAIWCDIDNGYEFGIFGTIKIGDRSNASLSKDVEGSSSFSYVGNDDGVSNKLQFDIKSACMVGWNLGNNVEYNDFKEHMSFLFEFSTILVRFMGSDRYLKNKELYDEYILDTLVQRMLLHISNYPLFLKTLSDLGMLETKKTGEVMKYAKLKESNIVYVSKVLFIYKVFYDMINECNTSTLIRSVSDMVSYLDISLRKVSTVEGLTNAFDVIAGSSRRYEEHGLRYIDYLIGNTYKKIDKLKRSYILTADYAAYQLNGGNRKLNELNVALESLQEQELPEYATVDTVTLKEIDSLVDELVSSMDNIVPSDEDRIKEIVDAQVQDIIPVSSDALESINVTKQKNYTKAELIGMLANGPAQKFRKLEAEANTLIAAAMNCDDVNTQSIVLRKIGSFVRVIGVYRNQYKNDDIFNALATNLEDRMYEIRDALVDRNFFKERATRLYGVARADFNY